MSGVGSSPLRGVAMGDFVISDEWNPLAYNNR